MSNWMEEGEKLLAEYQTEPSWSNDLDRQHEYAELLAHQEHELQEWLLAHRHRLIAAAKVAEAAERADELAQINSGPQATSVTVADESKSLVALDAALKHYREVAGE